METDDLAPSAEPSPAKSVERRTGQNSKAYVGEERRRMLNQVREFEAFAENFRSIRENRPPDPE